MPLRHFYFIRSSWIGQSEAHGQYEDKQITTIQKRICLIEFLCTVGLLFVEGSAAPTTNFSYRALHVRLRKFSVAAERSEDGQKSIIFRLIQTDLDFQNYRVSHSVLTLYPIRLPMFLPVHTARQNLFPRHSESVLHLAFFQD